MGGRSSSLAFPEDKKIVIVGAGFGGSELGRKLKDAKANFLLIDYRDGMFNNMAAVRAVAVPGFAKNMFHPYKPVFGDSFLQGKVVDVQPDKQAIKLASGEEVSYDTLVLATGTSAPFPSKTKEGNSASAISSYENYASKVKASNTIVVVGGGAAGVEVASEIATSYPDKKVTLIHSQDSLCAYPGVTSEFRQALFDKIKSFNNVDIKLNERVSNLGDIKEEGAAGTIKLESGENVPGDLLIKATGLKVQSEAYSTGPLSSVMDKNGALKVNEHLQVNGHKNIYALGDCTDVPENKMAMAAESQAKIVAQNISNGYSNQALTKYKAGSLGMAMVLALGKGIGMAQMAGNGKILPEMLANRMKAGDCMVSGYLKKFGQTPPAK